ncbi:uncharacterized protein F4807DRAFT_445768 [Annulohypoxylon truncatum]|uniref:uncharacterized protein n=1 Tax=Annulohypoxylon truncatum TaxID=327061 RepID=UPI002007ED80|nr:uncharacterized protein F4807DRAFT_445768 [Annulohypoxylon truncatum]KAI1204811.1 hypothetical protein F4807DRAFT_445768 [Annulohypoxylon truncatum]
MHVFTYLVLSFAGAAHGLPAFLAESKRSLINISPVIDLGLKLTNANSCLGLGVSVCDPITVNSTTADHASSSGSSPSKTIMELSNSGDDSLINLSPTITPDLDLTNENNCLGIGISACDPITVGSDVSKTVTNSDDSSSDEKPDTVQSSYPTATATSESTPTTASASASASASNSDSSSGGSLLDLSPNVSPDINLKNENSCQGIGISACDPITVNSTTTQNAS